MFVYYCLFASLFDTLTYLIIKCILWCMFGQSSVSLVRQKLSLFHLILSYLSCLLKSLPSAILLIHMSIIWIYVVIHVHLDGRLSLVAKISMLDITHKVFIQFFSHLPCILAPLTSTINLHLGWGAQGQCKTNTLGFIFSHTTDQDEI